MCALMTQKSCAVEMYNATLRNYLNYFSRPKLSLGSAHVKYGVWPGPAQMMTWSSFRKRNIEFLWMSTLKQSSFRNKKPPMVFIFFLDLILVLRRSIDIYIKSLRSSIQKYFFFQFQQVRDRFKRKWGNTEGGSRSSPWEMLWSRPTTWASLSVPSFSLNRFG